MMPASSKAAPRRRRHAPSSAWAYAWAMLVVAVLGTRAHAAPRPTRQQDDPRVTTDAPAGRGMPSVRRFALVVGANDGGHDRVKLQFAGSDAHAVARVLKDIGGVRSEDLIELSDPTPAELDAAFETMSKRLQAAASPDVRLQLVFYYSGHSDEQGLLLGGTTVKYPALRTKVKSTPADVKIAILDSCASGAFTRLKGGNKTAPFVVGSAAKVAGHAFLTSSSADEAAQESDRVGGSFFTHFLTSGLRGAADVDKDKIVTLSEAYQFAFDETLARTEATRGGPQHAAYDIALVGSGDLVMTDLRRTSARLEILPEVGGRIFVRNAKGDLAAELTKAEGNGPVLLALETGYYKITVDNGETLRHSAIVLGSGRNSQLSNEGLSLMPREGTVIRGATSPTDPTDRGTPPASASTYDEIPFNAGLVPRLSINGASGSQRIRNGFSVAAGYSRAARIDGVGLALGAVVVDEEMHGVSAAVGTTIARGTFEGAQLAQGLASAETIAGLQAAMVTHAKTMTTGVQFGLVNHVRTMNIGAQIGLVNVGGKMGGVQFGLVNYAREANASIGLIGATKAYGVHPEVWTSDIAAFNAGIRVGAKYTYTFLNVGLHPFGRGAGWLFGAGIGGHIPLGKRFYLDIDVAGHAYARGMKAGGEWSPIASLRVSFGWQALPRLSVFAGPAVRVLLDLQPRVDEDLPRGGLNYTVGDKSWADARIRVWPGFFVGLRF